MQPIKVLIADSNELIREGMKAVVRQSDVIRVIAESGSSSELFSKFTKNDVDVVIIDYSQPEFTVDDIRSILEKKPHTKILALTEKCEKNIVGNALKAGLNGHILYCCDHNEITEAICSVANGEKFYCGKVLDVLNGNANGSCAPVTLSPREIEIIALIADGLANKQIADKLCLSTHTVMTHRKNIMNKLGVNNTAGIVMYAVRENIINPNKYLFAP